MDAPSFARTLSCARILKCNYIPPFIFWHAFTSSWMVIRQVLEESLENLFLDVVSSENPQGLMNQFYFF